MTSQPEQAAPKQTESKQAAPSGVHEPLGYAMDAEFADWLPIGLLTLFCALFLFAIEEPGRRSFEDTMVAPAALVVGIGITAFALWRRFHSGGPLYVLSPLGVHIRGLLLKEILIPWHEIKAVETMDIAARHWLTGSHTGMISHGAVVVLVSKEFYDAHIHVGSFFMRGPGWRNCFIEQGELVKCALHPEVVSVQPKLLREDVETRWHAFRDQPAPVRPRRASVPTVIARRAPRDEAARSLPEASIVPIAGKPRPISWWEGIKIALPLIGIVAAGTDLLGLWGERAQTRTYEQKREGMDWRTPAEAKSKASDEGLKKER